VPGDLGKGIFADSQKKVIIINVMAENNYAFIDSQNLNLVFANPKEYRQ